MSESYDLAKLSPEAFENLVNFLALKTLGAGVTGFGPGADGGRDGYFEGEAPYPSQTDRWKGIWYIQSKFHKPHLSTDPQKWLIRQVENEIAEFERSGTPRVWPENWVIATNIDPSGKSETGSYDVIRKLVSKRKGKRFVNVAVWGGRKILDLLYANPDVAASYAHLLTPGHVMMKLYAELTSIADKRPTVGDVIRYCVATQFSDHLYTKLDRAASVVDIRPAVHDLFVDLPYYSEGRLHQEVLREITRASAQCLRYSHRKQIPESWKGWSNQTKRARTLLIKGGPGQGKSTIGQYLCQINRAALILDADGPPVIDAVKSAAKAVQIAAENHGVWPSEARLPLQVELKDFAHWYSERQNDSPKGILPYIAMEIGKKIGSNVEARLLKSIFAKRCWIMVFDGLDEVPNDLKDRVAKEVLHFLNDQVIEIDADILAICTSRPQGYSGQFAALDGPEISLAALNVEMAMACATPLLTFARSTSDSDVSLATLRSAINSPSIQELMTTPLQSHIMAMVIRDGGHPPEQRWRLFQSFYKIMKKRESLKDFKNPRIARLLREEDLLLKAVHMRLGFVLHARAERAQGAQATLTREEFRQLVSDVVEVLRGEDIESTVCDVMEATTERLVLVSTPDSSELVRFDIRQLQEYFAAEYLYDGLMPLQVGKRIACIGTDQHWREVTHFLLSALVADRRTAELAIAILELGKFNGGDSCDVSALYNRRAAISSLVVARLLIEGVLEEDQNDRQNLRSVFSDIGGVVDVGSLASLKQIRPKNSRKWVQVQIAEKIRTARPLEYNGALYLLGFYMPDSMGPDEAIAAFLNCPRSQQEDLLSAWQPNVTWDDPEYRSIESAVGPWVVRLALVILSSETWAEYKAKSINTLLNICRADRFVFMGEAEAVGLTESCAKSLWKILDRPEEINVPDELELDCGVVAASLFSSNWYQKGVPQEFSSINAQDLANSTGGAIRIMFACLRYGAEHTHEALKYFLTCAKFVPSKALAALPDFLLALMPIENWQSKTPCDISHLFGSANLTDHSEYLGELRANILPPYSGTITFRAGNGGWSKFAEMLPERAIEAAFGIGGMFTEAIRPDYTAAVRKLLHDRPTSVACKVLSWGFLASRDPALFQKIKDNVIASLEALPINDMRFDSKRIDPFELDLRRDRPLMKLFAPAMLSRWSPAAVYCFRWGTISLGLVDSLRKYGLDELAIYEIAISSEDAALRSATLALYWAMMSEKFIVSGIKTTVDLIEARRLYEELLCRDNAIWLSHSAAALLLNFSNYCSDALDFASLLLESHARFSLAGPVSMLISGWRERSNSPVTSDGVLAEWLGKGNESPPYAR